MQGYARGSLPDRHRNRGCWIWKRNGRRPHLGKLLHPKHCVDSVLFELTLMGNVATVQKCAEHECIPNRRLDSDPRGKVVFLSRGDSAL